MTEGDSPVDRLGDGVSVHTVGVEHCTGVEDCEEHGEKPVFDKI